jgi:CelD/BcsL family acetyltransferase involved in cellulose biosynthesis
MSDAHHASMSDAYHASMSDAHPASSMSDALRTSMSDAHYTLTSEPTVAHPPAATMRYAGAPLPLAAIAADRWRALAERALEPNGYHLPDWELAVNASSPGRTAGSALSAWSDAEPGLTRLIGLVPAISLWRACKIPLPALASADPYGTLGTPLLDRELAHEAVSGLMRQARHAGAHALILRDVTLDGAAMKTFAEVLGESGLAPCVLQSHARACLDARRDADELLRDALGAKKLKELRRQRHRLAEHGEIAFDVARTPAEVAEALEVFMALEASGWKARRGTALVQDAGDASFIRRATVALAAQAECEIVTLRAGATPVAAAIVLRHQDRAFYFKLGIDERFAKLSPGVQLTLDLTRHLCADPAIASADSTASAGHPMIDPIWRGRLAIGDVLIPLRRNDPVVSLIRAALTLQRLVREFARRAVRFVRSRQEKRAPQRTRDLRSEGNEGAVVRFTPPHQPR